MVSIRAKKAFDKMVENGGKVSPAMIEAGYSKNTAKNPKKLTSSKGWKELMDQYLPEDDLAKAHKELLNAGIIERLGFTKDVPDEEIRETLGKLPGCKILYIRHYKGSDSTVYVQTVDNNARKNALEMAYKLRGSYAPEKLDIKGMEPDKEIIDKGRNTLIVFTNGKNRTGKNT